MPRLSEAAAAAKHLGQLMMKRQTYQKGLEEIDALFSRFGINLHTSGSSAAPAKRGPGRPPGSGATAKSTTSKSSGGSRRRKRFGQTADEFILDLVKNKEMTTGEINKAWRSAGRGGAADNTLGKLV